MLSPLFVNLLCDQSRWVKTAAFQALGPFISTFADPTKTGLYYHEGGVVVLDQTSAGTGDSGAESGSSNDCGGMHVFEDHKSNDSGYCGAGSDSAIESPPDIEIERADDRDVQSEDGEDCSLVEPMEVPCLEIKNEEDEPSHLSSWRFCEPLVEAFELHDSTSNSIAINLSSKPVVNYSSSKQSEVANDNDFSDVSFWRTPIPQLDIDLLEDLQGVQNCTSDSQQNNVSEELCQSFTYLNLNDLKPENNNEPTSFSKLKSITFSDYIHQPMLVKSKLCVQEAKSEMISSGSGSILTFNNATFVSNDSQPSSLLNPFVTVNCSLPFVGRDLSVPFGYSPVSHYRQRLIPQDIIPNDLLEQYLSMTNPINYETVDPDLSYYCAYSLPAVALTLGRRYWPCLKQTYEILASDMQWKVRSILASSLNHMSLILGSDYTTTDLLPTFLSFMKDLDEVRYGILQNLADFLKRLQRSQRKGILPKLPEFLKMDNHRNWRFRLMLADQLVQLAPLYSLLEVKEYLFPIGLVLLTDKVAAVRLAATRVISALIMLFFQAGNSNQIEEVSKNVESNNEEGNQKGNKVEKGDENLDSFLVECIQKDVIREINANLAVSSKWIYRQTHVLLCERMVQDHSLSYSRFSDEMLSYLLRASSDPVPNVRLALSRCLSQTLWSIGKFLFTL